MCGSWYFGGVVVGGSLDWVGICNWWCSVMVRNLVWVVFWRFC